jgi:hypothetical protein
MGKEFLIKDSLTSPWKMEAETSNWRVYLLQSHSKKPSTTDFRNMTAKRGCR